MNCKHCNKEFDSKRSTAQYCSDICRVQHNRVSVTDSAVSVTKPTVSVTENSVTAVSVTPETVSVTDAPFSLTIDNLPEIVEELKNPASYTPDRDTQTPEGIPNIPLKLDIFSGIEMDKNHTDFKTLNEYQAYVIERNRQVRERIAATSIDKLKAAGVFIPAWRLDRQEIK